MVVLSLSSASLPATEIDLFVTEPLPFEDLWHRAIPALSYESGGG
jgi:hypothetical protein